MTNLGATKLDQERKVRLLLGLADNLHDRLSAKPGTVSDDVLLSDIHQQIKSLSDMKCSLSKESAKCLERKGRILWNSCLRQDRAESSATPSKLISQSRVFAFLLVCSSRMRPGRFAETTPSYLLKLSLSTGRLCMAENDLDAARLVLTKGAEYLELARADSNVDLPIHIAEMEKLEAEYLILRTALSWKEDRLDVAEHMFARSESVRRKLPPSTSEIMADTLQHIGLDMLIRGDHVLAIKWLKRANDLINANRLEELSISGLELRLSVCQSLVQCCLAMGTTDCLEEAKRMVSRMESEMGAKPVVLQWRLEILLRSPAEPLDVNGCASLLKRMIQSFQGSDATLDFLLHYVTSLHGDNPGLATDLMDELILHQLVPLKQKSWVGKALVRRIWMTTNEADVVKTSVVKLNDLLDSIFQMCSTALEPDITGAAHSLIWKRLDGATTEKRHEEGKILCELALHAIFSTGSQANHGKFARKLITCALELNDCDKAREVFDSMPECTQNEPLTRYIMFKLSLMTWDHDLGRETIEHLSKCLDKDGTHDIIYACVREAQQIGDKVCTLEALKAVIVNRSVARAPDDNFLPVLRCILRLIHLIEEEDGGTIEGNDNRAIFAADICDIFENAAKYAKSRPKDKDGNAVFTVPELQWFRKNAYNIGATRSHCWKLKHVIAIFSSCVCFIDSYPPDVPLNEVMTLTEMALQCHFVIAAALLSLAREEEQVDEKLQRYLEMRKHVSSFDARWQAIGHDQYHSLAEDLLGKASSLQVFDMEAAVHLKDWDGLSDIVLKAKEFKDGSALKAMGDCLLRSQAPGQVLFAALRLVVNEIYEIERFDSSELAKYVRCMLQAILPSDETSALQLLDQALQIAQEGKTVNLPFPPDELEWIVATSFNQAVEFYSRGDQASCHQWALKAMELAECMEDGGSMKQLLEANFAKLKF